MNYAEAIIDGYNAIAGAIVAVLSYILGEHWILFAAFLLLNVADWITGWMKSKMANKENSVRYFYLFITIDILQSVPPIISVSVLKYFLFLLKRNDRKDQYSYPAFPLSYISAPYSFWK